jgi:hypothetical protein
VSTPSLSTNKFFLVFAGLSTIKLPAENLSPARQQLARPRIAVVYYYPRHTAHPSHEKYPDSPPATPVTPMPHEAKTQQRSTPTASNHNGISLCHARTTTTRCRFRYAFLRPSAGGGRSRAPFPPKRLRLYASGLSPSACAGGRRRGRRRCVHAVAPRARANPIRSGRSRSSRSRREHAGPAAVWDLAEPS